MRPPSVYAKHACPAQMLASAAPAQLTLAPRRYGQNLREAA
jgi:hypothetical protein